MSKAILRSLVTTSQDVKAGVDLKLGTAWFE